VLAHCPVDYPGHGSYEASRQRWARLPSPNDDGIVIVHWLFPPRAEF
jgi:hypothetical protein